MRITRDHLIRLAREHTAQRLKAERDIISAYATGSILDEEPLLGGQADIDLVFVHSSQPAVEREFIRVSPEVHLDIAHQSQALYHQPRHLRLDAWLGATLFDHLLLLHDTQHWFEYIQASVRSQFWLPENVIQRVQPLLDRARQSWLGIQASEREAAGLRKPNEQVCQYLLALEAAANAIACLTGRPLTVRRFLLDFPQQSRKAGGAGLAAGLLGLLGAPSLDAQQALSWLPSWKAAYLAAAGSSNAPTGMHPLRLAYYLRAIESLLESEHPADALWPLLSTWNQAALALPGEDTHQGPFLQACQSLDLGSEQIDPRSASLDIFLDQIEEIVERWSAANGIGPDRF